MTYTVVLDHAGRMTYTLFDDLGEHRVVIDLDKTQVVVTDSADNVLLSSDNASALFALASTIELAARRLVTAQEWAKSEVA